MLAELSRLREERDKLRKGLTAAGSIYYMAEMYAKAKGNEEGVAAARRDLCWALAATPHAGKKEA